jgi:5-methylcytosine-specific restriction endonuclease McrA
MRQAPKPTQVAVFRRDAWLCRWCNRPVIFPPAMKYLVVELQASGNATPLAYYHPNWTRAHAPLLDELGAVVDHVEAFSGGGPTEIANLATACNKCNARKSAATLADWARRPRHKPVRGRYGEPQQWDGLSSFFVLLAGRHGNAQNATDKAWLRALMS